VLLSYWQGAIIGAMDSPVEILGVGGRWKMGGAAGTEETGVSMGYCVDEETSLNFEERCASARVY
jgi:hypothetical protein